MSQEDGLFRWLEQQYPLMVKTLFAWCDQNSGSYNAKGLRLMASVIKETFSSLTDDISSLKSMPILETNLAGERHTLTLSDALLIRGPKRGKNALKVLLTGHMDTVFAIDSPFQTTTKLEENIINGPGCADMKGGLLVIYYALSAFEKSKYKDLIEWTVLINADEELGSIGSRHHLATIARENTIGLVYEPSMDLEGSFAGERKGSGKFTIAVHGRSAHAGREFDKGRNAICLLSEIITEVNQLNGQRDDLTLNVGLIQGGSALNAVPDMAVAKIDVRLKALNDREWVNQAFSRIIERFQQKEGYEVLLTGGFSRTPKPLTPNTRKLFSIVESLSKALDFPYKVRASGGCCDGNNLQEEGLAVIDTLGVIGSNIHSSNEKMILSSLLDRSKLSLKLLCHLAKKGLENE